MPIHFDTVLKSTPAQEEEAFNLTRETLTKLRDLGRSLEIPASELGLIVSLYTTQLSHIMNAAADAVRRVRSQKIDKIINVRRRASSQHAFDPLGNYDPINIAHDLDQLDDSELDTMIANLPK